MQKKRTTYPNADRSKRSSPGRDPGRVDHYAQVARDLPESTAEVVSRMIIRVVPLIYGVLLGLVIDDLALGALAGLALAAALDLAMRERSLLMGALRRLGSWVCPPLAVLARTVARLATRLGLGGLRGLCDVRCGIGGT
ncbi:MAG: hypothetical protein H6959_06950 [Chromatiaceae bacterium]|nr:hypothetical protein [Gammaproteobacteria bacterium]MCP5300568.1 hypothetical protein [Chromatiaceae bacterium]MCP5422640.1 hypothetical protein [Chromatiaceae bacterium]